MRVATPLVLSLLAALWGHASVPPPPGPDPLAPRNPYAQGCSFAGPPPREEIATRACRLMSTLINLDADKVDPCDSGLLMSEIWRDLGREPSDLIVDLDPWKHPYRVECLAGYLAVASAGVDGVFDTGDDIRFGVPDLYPKRHHHLGPNPREP